MDDCTRTQVRAAPKTAEEFLLALKAQDPQAELLSPYLQSKTKASFQGSSDLRSRAGVTQLRGEVSGIGTNQLTNCPTERHRGKLLEFQYS
ncbi:hypothetical protein [Kitasatospora indigofera]|uniref:hypothetical protein n=1 Tax=Kitasatospora indigofera TaxID=67307 RepID=UPI0033AA34B1